LHLVAPRLPEAVILPQAGPAGEDDHVHALERAPADVLAGDDPRAHARVQGVDDVGDDLRVFALAAGHAPHAAVAVNPHPDDPLGRSGRLRIDQSRIVHESQCEQERECEKSVRTP